MHTIAIIGAGQLGSRHLQALALLRSPATIYVVDPSVDSLKTAESRFKEVSSEFTGSVSYHTSIAEIGKVFDVVIVATGSKVRRQTLEQLLAHAAVKNIVLEKFLFVKKSDYAAVGKLLAEKKIRAWVNCPRRMMAFYRQLQEELPESFHFTATGNGWGLGCNGIHMLDLFAFLTRTGDISLSEKLVDEKINESRRRGYVEFNGTITGQTSHHVFRMTSFPGDESGLFIMIDTPDARYCIDEGAKAKVRTARKKNGWQWEESSFEMPFQSQLTTILVEEILKTGACSLPSYEESARLHELLLNGFLSFLRTVKNDSSIDECLIT